jgi:hypothetical protein
MNMCYKRQNIPVWRVHFAYSLFSLCLFTLARMYENACCGREWGKYRTEVEVIRSKNQQLKQRAQLNWVSGAVTRL